MRTSVIKQFNWYSRLLQSSLKMPSVLATATCLVCQSGCSQLVVRKITPECRNTEEDYKTKGFRYYLARPYVIVKEPILVSVSRRIEPVRRELLDPLLKSPETQTIKNNCAESPLTCDELAKIRALLSVPTTPPKPAAAGGGSGTQDQGAAQGGAPAPGELIAIADTEIKEPANLKGKIDIQFLPDLDEEYAVHHRNMAAIGSYKMVFKDGWQLMSVDGAFDSTTVALEIIKTIESAIGSTASATDTKGSTSSTTAGGAKDVAGQARAAALKGQDHVLVTITTTRSIMPGVYRFNKPWEVNDPHAFVGAGFLSHLGLEMTETVEYGLAETPK